MVDLQAPYLKIALAARISVQEHRKASVPSYTPFQVAHPTLFHCTISGTLEIV